MGTGGWHERETQHRMSHMSVIVRFNGKDLPAEMKSLSPGQYVVEPVEETPPLTPEEEAGLRSALASLREGRGVDLAEVRRRIEALLG